MHRPNNSSTCVDPRGPKRGQGRITKLHSQIKLWINFGASLVVIGIIEVSGDSERVWDEPGDMVEALRRYWVPVFDIKNCDQRRQQKIGAKLGSMFAKLDFR
eukprot:9007526-Karenia_brevis.AAC.1